MGGVGGVGGNQTIVVGTTAGRIDPKSALPADDPLAFLPGDGAVLDAHSSKAGDFTESRKLPDGQKVFLTPDGARVFDRLEGIRGNFKPMLFKDSDTKAIQKALQDWVTPGELQKPVGVGNAG